MKNDPVDFRKALENALLEYTPTDRSGEGVKCWIKEKLFIESQFKETIITGVRHNSD